jgi:uncharacterized protein YndB with AHSA1/START domain
MCSPPSVHTSTGAPSRRRATCETSRENLTREREREVPIIRVDSSIVIDRPPDEVFAYATDPAHTPEWQSSALETSVDGPVQAGASGKEVRKFLGRRMESTMKIEAFEPPRRFALQVTSGPVPFHVEQTVEPDGTGSRVSVTIEGEPGGFFKLADPLVERAVRRELEGNLATLKDILETRN